MEQNNYLDIIEGMLYLAGDDGVDIKQVAGVLEISKKEATLLNGSILQKFMGIKL